LSEALFARAPVSGQRDSVIDGTGEGFYSAQAWI